MALAQKRKLVIDARMVGSVPHGIARYVSLIARTFERSLSELPVEPWYLIDFGRNPQPDSRSFPKERCIAVKAPFLSVRELWEVPKLLKREGASWFWSPSFSSYLGLPCPWMVTVHDLNHLYFGSLFQKLYYRFLLKPFCLQAARVLTVSEFSRGELANWLGLSRDQIAIVPNAIDPDFVTASVVSLSEAPQKGYFLCLGSPKPHKNVRVLLEAYCSLRASQAALGVDVPELVLSGVRSAVDLRLPQAFDEGVRFMPSIPENELKSWIAGAIAMVFPSTYEGFGLPPVEAAALGTPVIVSDISAHREGLRSVAREVFWFQADSRSALQAQMMACLKNDEPPHLSLEKVREDWSIEKLHQQVREVLKESAEVRG
ncbi:MAG: glycosyltransferase family 4 protein [Bdellovibrionales bacterium]|nr:glycosyltransferase family 4 protein [Bdellovibrionales bacterium]